MGKKTKQHFVPKSYLSAWCFDEKQVFICDLESKDIHHGEPKSILRKKNLYTNKDFGEEQKLLLEDLFGEIESDGMPALRKIVEKVKIDHIDRSKIAWFIAAQKARVPMQMEIAEEIAVKAATKRMLENIEEEDKFDDLVKYLEKKNTKNIEEVKKDPKKYFTDLAKKVREGAFSVSVKNKKEYWQLIMFKMLKPLSVNYLESDWYVLRAGKGKAFITSDNPVVTISDAGGLENPLKKYVKDIEVTFPVSPKVMILIKIAGGKRGLYELSTYEDLDSVKELNYRTTSFADRFTISNSEALLRANLERHYATWDKIRKNQGIEQIIQGRVPTVNSEKGNIPPFLRRSYK
ncbi:MAG: DUF4238 domain-containing protein [Candidatus Gracilibacteria bacterium]